MVEYVLKEGGYNFGEVIFEWLLKLKTAFLIHLNMIIIILWGPTWAFVLY